MGTVVEGNKIGTDTTGTAAIPNNTQSVGSAAVEVSSGPTTIGGATAGAANVISGNTEHGIAIRGADTGADHGPGKSDRHRRHGNPGAEERRLGDLHRPRRGQRDRRNEHW